MQLVLALLQNTVCIILSALQLAMFIRAIMSWFPQMQGSRIYEFIYGITEPVVMPFRKLIQNVDALRGFPIDISFMLAFMTIIFLEILLQGMI